MHCVNPLQEKFQGGTIIDYNKPEILFQAMTSLIVYDLAKVSTKGKQPKMPKNLTLVLIAFTNGNFKRKNFNLILNCT